jgi:DNA-binding response OmpR family regulator
MSHRALLIGVSEAQLRSLELSLRHRGLRVTTSTDVQQATALARQVAPTLVVLVADLGVAPGPDWFAMLRMHAATAALPLVVLSAPLPHATAVAALQAGAILVLRDDMPHHELNMRLKGITRGAIQTGPEQLRRVVAYLADLAVSGVLRVRMPRGEATIHLAQGRVTSARLGGQEVGRAVIDVLLNWPGSEPWSFLLQDAPLARSATRTAGPAMASLEGTDPRARMPQPPDRGVYEPMVSDEGYAVAQYGEPQLYEPAPQGYAPQPPQQGYVQLQQAYAQPQQSYAQPQKGYAQPQQPYTQPPQPYTQPPQPYAQPQQSYAQPPQPYTQPQQPYAPPPQPYPQPQQGYAQPQQGYAQPQQPYTQPQPSYAQPQPSYAQPQQGYEQPQQGYAQPPQGYVEAHMEYAPAPSVAGPANPWDAAGPGGDAGGPWADSTSTQDVPAYGIAGDTHRDGDPWDDPVPGEDEMVLDDSFDERAPPPLPPPLPLAIARNLPPVRVLVVEDDPELVRLYASLLSRSGMSVETAQDGKAGYFKARAQRPDVILSDIMMPGTDGWALLSLVRDDYRLRETKLLLLSFHRDLLVHLRDFDAGADDYMEKGVRAEEFVARVRASVQDRRAFLASLRPDVPAFSGMLSVTGTQHLLDGLCQAGVTGALDVQDGWSSYHVLFERGVIATATARSGDVVMHDLDALCGLVAVDEAPYTFEPRRPGSEHTTLGESFQDVAESLHAALNLQREQSRDLMLSQHAPLVFHPEMVQLYLVHCTDAARPVAQALTRGIHPRDLIARRVEPTLVNYVVRDMLRKGVARIEAVPTAA